MKACGVPVQVRLRDGGDDCGHAQNPEQQRIAVREPFVSQNDSSSSGTSGGELIKIDHLAALLGSKAS